ncbi:MULTISPECIES: vitamin B12-dependent ribonucleotide reductase [Thermodesulfovibrio]|uniref:Vitamin B12-dependent ribonucleotide reductase n=1 Tax=Thermodesulfovibrio yellowstonii (strain ATCC 51303 / DSM 11347 / YP87) TaxID=289376 RepID=B5YHG0_THEYD|nr:MULTISPECIES: vitamin B12-dependent ribonucleotide reductase [Thermodesulfovibrio]ACI20593.1 ribonucleoside-diphosphate reductase, adenosylcobalamin-dependent [Thermodesulfovibrio yellowstonii DSM 11347]MDI6865276.1 vitamin B12-dependent ribonucleotide reductase [Thermodesulfovibrio yellowstonii]
MEKIKQTFELTDNAIEVLKRRYLKKNEDGILIETPEELFTRVATAIAQIDTIYGKSEKEVYRTKEEFFELMTSLRFLPNSPTLMNAGTPLGQLSACFVLPVEDSMEGIFDAVKYAAIIHKSGGGTGFSFSRLRPKGDVVGSTKGISSGPVSFMSVFDSATEAVKQGGRRRGANMGLLRVDHPDILEFITCKDDLTKFTNFNISVGLTEEFMKAVINDEEYELINPRSGKIVKRLKAKEVFDLIVHQAWKNGEPGIVFLDRINAANPTPSLGEIEATNPCGEQPLLPYESCNLGSINLAKMVKDNSVDWELLKDTVWKAVHFLDNVIDANKYPLSLIEQNTKANRKIGLGVMGWADMLIQLKIPYNSKEALNLAEELMKFILHEGRLASKELAKERGTFPNYAKSIYYDKMPLRNATITTIAPTGTLSIIAGCSSGIEPLFALCFARNVMDGTRLVEVNPYFKKEMEKIGIWSDSLADKIAETGSIQGIKEIPEEIKKIFVTAHEVSPSEHIRMQAAFQQYVDNAVSKTVNLPNQATEEDVREVYLLAYRLGCKGVTVYRDGSRHGQVIQKGKTESPALQISLKPRKRPETLKGVTRLMKTGCGNLYVTINKDKDGKPFEVFTNIGKAGGCAASQAEAIGRLISLALRSGIEPQEIVKQLKGISCHAPVWSGNGKITSCSDAIAKAIEAELRETKGNSLENKEEIKNNSEAAHYGACPECGSSLSYEEGCVICHSCGFTRCS